MSDYDYHNTLKAVYEKAVALYRDEKRDSDTYFNAEETEFLKSVGATAQEIYDFAEDANNYGEPDYEHFILIQDVRRDYFLNVQKGVPSNATLDEDSLPAKTDSVRGVEWLPRLMPKARAKLRGELPKSLMYCCGGDRRFFKTHDIHPAEFLRAVWAYQDNDDALVDWVISRSKAEPANA